MKIKKNAVSNILKNNNYEILFNNNLLSSIILWM